MRLQWRQATRFFRTPLYPLLFAAFTVLRYASYHNTEASVAAVVVTIVLAGGISFLILVGLSFIKNVHLRAGVGVFLTLFVLSYANLRTTFLNWRHIAWFSSGWLYIIILIPIVGAILLWLTLVRHKAIGPTVTSLLTVAILYLVASSGYQLVRICWQQAAVDDSLPKPIVSLPADHDKPDIYYLVFEDYTGNGALRKLYGYDNSQIVNDLTDRGFYVPEQSTTNYYGSFHSVASSLNLDYLNTLTAQAAPADPPRQVLQSLIEDHEVGRSLKADGYSYYHLGSWYDLTRTSWIANVNITHSPIGLPLPNLTAYYLADGSLVGTFANQVGAQLKQDIIRQKINDLGSIAKQSTGDPKFTFAHIMLPHGPIEYDKDCHELPPNQTIDPENHPLRYIGQIACANKMILQVVDEIKANSPKPPIIIVQSDEGQDLEAPEPADLTAWSDNALLEKFPIFNAIYFPDEKYTNLYQTITPVNMFRVVFNQYLGGNLKLLPDKNYMLPDYYSPYGAVDMTDRVQRVTKAAAAT